MLVFFQLYVSYLEKTLRHDKSPEFDYPYLWDYMGIHYIYLSGFVQRIHPINFTPVGVIAPVISNPMGFS